jgi:surface-anchored protein
VTVTLTGAAGSGITAGGQFSLWQGSVTPNFFMSTFDGISGADSYTFADLTAEDHAHFNWAFTEEGIYDLTFEISGTHAGDGFKSATATYTFSVIPEPSSALLGAFGALALLRRRRN